MNECLKPELGFVVMGLTPELPAVFVLPLWDVGFNTSLAQVPPEGGTVIPLVVIDNNATVKALQHKADDVMRDLGLAALNAVDSESIQQ